MTENETNTLKTLVNNRFRMKIKEENTFIMEEADGFHKMENTITFLFSN